MAFSFARAIQQPALEIWQGNEANVRAAQQALLHRARCNRAARRGEYNCRDGKDVNMTTSKQCPCASTSIRHGETEWSLSGQYTGRTDIPLTAHGEEEARELGLRIRDIPFTRVLTSPLKRAQQTCALAGLIPAAEIEPDLAEWDNGADEGRTPAEILASRPGWNLFRDGSPDGETPGQVSLRVTASSPGSVPGMETSHSFPTAI